jgi:hypothetical protein
MGFPRKGALKELGLEFSGFFGTPKKWALKIDSEPQNPNLLKIVISFYANIYVFL